MVSTSSTRADFSSTAVSGLLSAKSFRDRPRQTGFLLPSGSWFLESRFLIPSFISRKDTWFFEKWLLNFMEMSFIQSGGCIRILRRKRRIFSSLSLCCWPQKLVWMLDDETSINTKTKWPLVVADKKLRMYYFTNNLHGNKNNLHGSTMLYCLENYYFFTNLNRNYALNCKYS